MEGKECFSTINDRIVSFNCKSVDICCGSRCCSSNVPFYTHWYFWLAVCMLLVVVIGFALSACRHFWKQQKHQQRCARIKTVMEADLQVQPNVPLMPTDVLSLPKYEDVVTTSGSPQSHVIVFPALPVFTPTHPPPPYSHCSNINSNKNSNRSSDHESNPAADDLPPAYTHCVIQE